MNLQLPPFDYRLERGDDGVDRIYDCLRKKFVALTPEEWVRQHFVNFLITTLGYPKGLMANEVSLKLNNTRRRCDSLIYTRDGRPLMIVEYKAPDITITQAVFDQIARYNSVIGADYLVVSNGIKNYCCRFNHDSNNYIFLREIPEYTNL